jgi:hypothetical protein
MAMSKVVVGLDYRRTISFLGKGLENIYSFKLKARLNNCATVKE